MRSVNVIFINGMGGKWTSQSLARMRMKIIGQFGDRIYAPPAVDYRETGLILRYLSKWKDDQIFVGLSCGCSTINEVLKLDLPGEKVPYAMYLSPSRLCGIGARPIPKIVQRAQEVNSNALDVFNLGGMPAVHLAPGNKTTVLDKPFLSGYGHGFTPDSPVAIQKLSEAISRAVA